MPLINMLAFFYLDSGVIPTPGAVVWTIHLPRATSFVIVTD